MKIPVVQNAKRNIIYGTINKIIIMLCPFIIRIAVNQVLGMQFLGLDSLFGSIIGILSLSELGFSTVIVYFMYKPVSNNDVNTVNALLSLYKRVYRIIGLVILLAGLCILPFIDLFIHDNLGPQINIRILFVMYLINTSLSYFLFAYKSSIIVVNQRDDLNSNINSITKVLLTISQGILLYYTRNYYCYIFIMLIFTVLNNLWIALVVKKQFPEYHPEGKIPREIVLDIKQNIVGAFIQKACMVTRNSIDSICLSAILGLTATALYNNYYLILKNVAELLSVFGFSFLGGIGNHVAIKKADENFEELCKMDFVYMSISGWCTACLLCLYQPFMNLWMGNDSLLSYNAVILFSMYFYLLKMGDMRYLYVMASGLFWEQRWRSIVETIMNITLNILLGKFFGIYGIITATMISMLLCNFIWANKITFEKYFGMQYLKKYYAYQAKYLFINILVCLLTVYISSTIKVAGNVSSFFIKTFICILIPGILYSIIYRDRIAEIKVYFKK